MVNNLYRVGMTRRGAPPHDEEPLFAAVLANNEIEAERLCRESFGHQGFTKFEVSEPAQGPFLGTARAGLSAGRKLTDDPTPTLDQLG
jgi:hypothetical protein